MGDGGAQGDPHGFAQCTGRKKADFNPASCSITTGSGPSYYLLGKIIRLDVHNVTSVAMNLCGVPKGEFAPYAVPQGNPFSNAALHPNKCAEIFNWGLRNPFRFSFDRQTGDMSIGDVGQEAWEEVNFQPVASPGQNFQWNLCEGQHTYPGGTAPCVGPPGSIPPRLEYAQGCAVNGGYVYRGPIEPLQGQYIFGDWCNLNMYIVADPAPDSASWAFERLPMPPVSVYSFGEDEQGNLYVADGYGPVYLFHSQSGGDLVFRDGFEVP